MQMRAATPYTMNKPSTRRWRQVQLMYCKVFCGHGYGINAIHEICFHIVHIQSSDHQHELLMIQHQAEQQETEAHHNSSSRMEPLLCQMA